MPEWFPLHTQTHFVSLSKSPTRDSKFFSESAGKERLKYEGRMANGTYIYVHISLIYNLWNITLPVFFTPGWASSMCAEAKCQRTFGRKGTLVCTKDVPPWAQEKSTPEHRWLHQFQVHWPRGLQLPRAGPRSSDVSWIAYITKCYFCHLSHLSPLFLLLLPQFCYE